jgi:CubicO group peptidase (beta-lactamase class C family)
LRRYLPILFVILAGCKEEAKQSSFTTDLDQLQEYFHVPGMAVIVTKGDSTLYEGYFGYADVENEQPVDSTTVFPMASLTKMFTGYLIAQYSQRGLLEQPINRWVTNQNIPDSIKVKHVLSHTSEGEVGKHFHYSSRFSWLTDVIQTEGNGTMELVLNSNITAAYEMNNTFLLTDSSALSKRKYAKPYVFDGETKPGFVDYGYSASAGLTSTVRDLAKFSKMIANTMVEFDRAPGEKYKYGLFGQEVGGMRVLWAYGQYDCYSSLFLKVPERELTFIIAGNNSLLSDPARLIYGDVTTSLFALSFFKNYLNLDLPDEKLRAEAIAASYMGMYDSESAAKSKELLRKVFQGHGNYRTLATMHNISFLKEIAAHNGEPNFTGFDRQLKSIGYSLLKEDPNDPYANIYMAGCYDAENNTDSARVFYTRVAEAKNAVRNWYTNEAENWLKQHSSTSAPGTTSPQQE